MKSKISLLLVSILIINNIHAELKYFLPHSNAVMSILDYKYWFDGDTIIENNRYTKVHRQFCTSETECGELEYYAAVREDTIGEKIYCRFAYYRWRPFKDIEEKLLADFAVKKGDSVMVYADWNPSQYPAVVESVDSITINGQERKRVNLVGKYYYGADSWVEGLGSIVHGLFFPNLELIMDVGYPPMFLCLHIDNILVYQNPDYNVCYVKDSGVGIAQKEPSVSFTVSPVLADDCLYVKGEDITSCFYTLYDARGAVIQSDKLTNDVIDVRSLSSGIYFIRFYTDKNSSVYAGKFVKH